ncbi:molybdate transport system ATP-binding protein [Poseidonocella pacifica]|uniref:Molybdate transport system ATP-binding protein n=1 Tax=Poseidonocella pacifica TaxID=871651 RepID=A0A1I0XZA5_9RHOB|nr:molybdenum ABC transporter ATP-binding protein [Poseidonocella pacifica]SFB05700.1 molybdate transport system ATP-binding protein [Poseidonocella pacifica]
MLDIAVRHRFSGFNLDAAFTAPAGLTALFGRSGSGKTTLVNAVAGLIRPDAGRATVGGATLFDTSAGTWQPPHRRQIGYVFQEGRLFPHLTVRQNLGYSRLFPSRKSDAAEFDRVVALLGLGSLLERRPGALSGGEKQRVAVGRALLSRPRLLLMDEPLAALDDARKAEILPWIERLRDETDLPILYVSHSVAEVARLATTVVLLEKGSVIRSGPAEEMLAEPALAPAFGVRHAGALVAGRVIAQHDDGITELAIASGPLFLPRVDVPLGTELRVRIAAQDVILASGRPEGLSALNILPVEVLAVRQGAGPGVMVQLGAGSDRLLARITRRSAEALSLTPGTRCHAIVKSVSVAPADIGGDGPA